jgi:hypothetical protein
MSVGLAVVFLIAAPAIALAAPLRGLDILGRTIVALAGAVVVSGLVAVGMAATSTWSIAGGVAAVGVISAIIWLSISRFTSGLREVAGPAEKERGDGAP